MPVKIHGKEYLTVAERIRRLKEDDLKYSLMTQLISWEDGIVIMKATLIIEYGDTVRKFTGHAYENESSSQINKTSALENCETSAIGRALAAAGFGGSEYASANEVENAVHQQSPGKTEEDQFLERRQVTREKQATDKQKEFLSKLLSSSHLTDDYKNECLDHVNNGITVEEASNMIDETQNLIQGAKEEERTAKEA